MSEDHADVPPSAENRPATSGESAEQPIAPEVLKSAYNAFKKRWKLTRLDEESHIGRGPMSSGQRSTIIGISAPDQFPRAVWDELVKTGKIKRAGQGLYSMP